MKEWVDGLIGGNIHNSSCTVLHTIKNVSALFAVKYELQVQILINPICGHDLWVRVISYSLLHVNQSSTSQGWPAHVCLSWLHHHVILHGQQFEKIYDRLPFLF